MEITNMKRIVLYLVVLLISSCRSESEIATLIEQARWGDGQACLKLADRYRDGNGLEQDFLGMMGMVSKAEELRAINNMEDYLKMLPEDSNFKLFFDATEKYAHRQTEEAWTLAEQLIVNGSPDGYLVQGLITGEQGDTLEGKRLMEKSASLGSTVAEFFLCLPEDSSTPDVERVIALSNRVPYVNILLAKLYRGERMASLRNDSLAADCLLKGERHGFLGRKDAQWLLGYYENEGNVQLTEEDIKRLQKLANNTFAE